MPVHATRILRHTGLLGGGLVITRLTGFAVTLYLARILTPQQFGILGIAAAVAAYAAILVQGGFDPAAVRRIARDPAALGGILALVVRSRLLVILVVAAAVAVLSPWLAPRLGVPHSLLLMYLLPLIPAGLTPVWSFRGLERMEAVAGWTVVEALVRALLIVGGLTLFAGVLITVPAAECIAGLIAVAGAYWFLARRGHRPRHDSKTPPLRLEAAPVLVTRLVRTFYIHGHVMLLGALAGGVASGQFLAANRLLLAIGILPGLLTQGAYPISSRLAASDPAALARQQEAVLRLALIGVVFAAAAGAVYAAPLMHLLFGAEYALSGRVLPWLLLAAPATAAAIVLLQALYASETTGRGLLASAGGLGVHLCGAFILIPDWGPLGAAWSLSAGEWATALLLLLACRRNLGGWLVSGRTLTVLAAGAAAVAVAVLAGRGWLGALLGIGLYAVCVVSLGVNRAERRYLFNAPWNLLGR